MTRFCWPATRPPASTRHDTARASASRIRMPASYTGAFGLIMSTSASRTAFTVLIAVSVSHLLNDLLQSLLPAIYPMLKAKFDLDFLQIGLITLANQLTASLLQPVVGHFTDRRPQPYSLAARHDARRWADCCCCRWRTASGCFSSAAALIGVGSAVFHPESSRIARAGVRRSARLRAVVLSDRRQRRIVARPAARGVHRRCRAARAASRGFRSSRSSASRFSGASGAGTRTRGDASRGRDRAGGRRPACRARVVRRGIAILLIARVLEVRVPREPDELLHVLPDSQVSAFRADRAAPSVRAFSARCRGGHVRRRADRRSRRPQGRDLGVDPRRAAVHADAAVRQSLLDRGAQRRDRPDPRVGVLRDSRVRPGTCAAARRPRVGALLRFCVRRRAASPRRLLGKLADATSIDVVYRVCAFLPALGLLTAFLPDTHRERAVVGRSSLGTREG